MEDFYNEKESRICNSLCINGSWNGSYPGVAVKADDKKLIGVTMPTKDLQRWNQDGENMKKELEAAGYEVDLQYASNDVSTQVSQLENQVANGCDLLVVASIDGSSLGEPLKQAKEAGIPVISYDRLLMNSDAVTYYATFDNYKVGQKQGEYLVDALDLDNQDGPFNIELFTGDPGDNNCNFFFGGAMDVLQKYIDEGKLVVKSDRQNLSRLQLLTGTVQRLRTEWIQLLQVTTQMAPTLTQFSAPMTLQHLA